MTQRCFKTTELAKIMATAYGTAKRNSNEADA